MKKFMVDIVLVDLDMETRLKYLPQEQEGVRALEAEGTILHNFIKLDRSGIYMVVMAADQDDIHKRLSFLPYYPYMKIKIDPVRVVNEVNE